MTTKTDPVRRRKAIKRRLREIKRDPSAAVAGEVQKLSAEYRRLLSAERAPDPATPVAGLTEEEAAAVASWPAELRARVNNAAMNRVIAPWVRG